MFEIWVLLFGRTANSAFNMLVAIEYRCDNREFHYSSANATLRRGLPSYAGRLDRWLNILNTACKSVEHIAPVKRAVANRTSTATATVTCAIPSSCPSTTTAVPATAGTVRAT